MKSDLAPGQTGADAVAMASQAATVSTSDDHIEQLKQEKKAAEDKLLRLLAETENFKRRKNEDVLRQMQKQEQDMLLQFLPVIDSLEKALADMPGDEAYKGLREGVTLTEKMFRGLLEKYGVSRIVTAGQSFDPALHQAIGQQAKDGAASGSILTEVMPGYKRKDAAIRPALVIVAE